MCWTTCQNVIFMHFFIIILWGKWVQDPEFVSHIVTACDLCNANLFTMLWKSKVQTYCMLELNGYIQHKLHTVIFSRSNTLASCGFMGFRSLWHHWFQLMFHTLVLTGESPGSPDSNCLITETFSRKTDEETHKTDTFWQPVEYFCLLRLAQWTEDC